MMTPSKNLIPVAVIPFEEADGSFIDQELPIILKGGAKNWPAYQKWSVEFFKEHYGNVQVPMSNYRKAPYQDASTKPTMPISDYLDSALRIAAGEADKNEDLYSAGWFFCRHHCELLKDITPPQYFQQNWVDQIQKVVRFDTRSILFGHPKVESPLHTDSFFVSVFFAMIRGQKRMRLIHPKDSEHVQNGYPVFDSEKVAELEKKGVVVYDCTISEGDIVWFPPGWWHHVQNNTFTISITTNFVSSRHFLPFEQQVRATLIKPLLRLSDLKNQVLSESDCLFSTENLENSRFCELEKKYVNHFKEELQKTDVLLEKIANSA